MDGHIRRGPGFELGITTSRADILKVSRSAHYHVDPASQRHCAHLWKAVAPFVSLEESLFSQHPRWLDECAEAFVQGVLPEATPAGRAA